MLTSTPIVSLRTRTVAFAEPIPFAWENIKTACTAAGFALVWDTGDLVSAAEIATAITEPWTHFTINAAEYEVLQTDSFSADEIAAAQTALVEDEVFGKANWMDEYLAEEFEISESVRLRFMPEALARIAVKFGWAVAWAAELAGHARREVEVRFEPFAPPTGALEHFFVARELQRRGVDFGTLTLRMPGGFEPAAEFAGDVEKLQSGLAEHVAIARTIGPHRIGVRHAEHKFAALPAIARECGSLLHLQVEGLHWMEAMRTLTRTEPTLFREVLACAHEHFSFDRSGFELSITEDDIRFLPAAGDAELEQVFLDDVRGRQLLHVTAYSIMAEAALAESIRTAMATHGALFGELCAASLARHLDALRLPEGAP